VENESKQVGAGVRRVVAAVDGSNATEVVLEAVSRLPFADDASILIVYVARWGLTGNSPVAHALIEQRGREILVRAAATLANVLRPKAGSPRVETAQLLGQPFVEIIRRARDESADLVVVGRHGERTFLEALIGTTADRIVRKGTTPVLVATQMPTGGYKRPLVAVDLSDTCGRAVALASRLVGPNTPFDIIHAHEPDADVGATRASVEAFLEPFALPGRGTLVLRPGDPRTVLLDEMRTRGTDLIVLGTHGNSAIRQILIGSVAEAVMQRATCDVLIARDDKQRYEAP
jgi:nucleotide-binding universal stress UspA family protein